MSGAEAVRTALAALLPTVDLFTTTERKIRQQIASSLGAAVVEAHKKLIKEEIDAFLAQQAAQGQPAAGEAGSDDDYQPDNDDDSCEFEFEEGAAGGAGKRKRGSSGGPQRGKPPAKRAAGAAAPAPVGPGGASWQLGGSRKYARVDAFRGSLRVDLREFYEKGGELAPTPRGIALQPAEWQTLAASLPAVLAAAESGNLGFELQLSGTRKVSVGEFRGSTLVQLREFYEASGQLLPSKKGIALQLPQMRDLAAAAATITAQLAAAPQAATTPATSTAAPAAGATTGVAQGGGTSVAGSVPRAQQQAQPTPLGEANPQRQQQQQLLPGEDGEQGAVVDLGGNKRLSLSNFKGKQLVDLREWYQKDGAAHPGKKGISLTLEQWGSLSSKLADISEAVDRRDAGYRLQLGSRRSVALSNFKGQLYVDVREYYEKGGQLLPGAKGLSMNLDQWARLVAGAAAFNAQLGG